MIIVSDTSPISNLIKVGQIDLLRQIFSRVIIPQAVFDEICRVAWNREVLLRLDWIEVLPATNIYRRYELLETLDVGEADAIALALDLRADFILIDEIAGRNTAELLGLRIIGILGVLIRAKKKGLISEIEPIIDRLVNEAGFRLSPSLIDRTLKSVGER